MSAQEATKNVDSVNETNQNAGDAKLPEDGMFLFHFQNILLIKALINHINPFFPFICFLSLKDPLFI